MPVVAVLLFSLLALATAASGAGAGDFEGKPCDDHDPCTMDDRYVGGMCRGTSRPCDDGLPCTEDFCDRASGRCGAGLRIDHCLIDGACYRDGESSPANRCMVCRPARSMARWTETTVCDDDDPCTLDDRCVEGRCEGSRYTCAGIVGCTTSRCDGRGGCVEELLPGHCRIAGACARKGDLHPTDSCLRCDPEVAIGDWSPATGAACPGGTCSDGACLATLVIEVEGAGTGRVLGPGFACTGACIQHLAPERAIDLTVVPDNGSVFRGWKGACLGLAPCQLTPYGHVSVSARFDRDTSLQP
jgi:hypothetical protein